MKNYIYKLAAAFSLLFLAASCSTGDDTLTTLSTVTFSAAPNVTPNTIVLSPANNYESVVTISWPAVQFPVNAPVTYAIQIDVASDIVGGTAWANAKRFVAGENVLSKSFLGSELNAIAKDLGLAVDEPGQLVVRVEATLNQTVYSAESAFTVTPFLDVITETQIYMPGAYQGWNPAEAATLQAIENGVFQGYITFPAGQLEFKFTKGPNWDDFYGNNEQGNFAEGGDTNLAAPAAGSYQVTVNLNTMTYTLTPYSWGVVGTATPGGWDVDTDMVYDYQNQQWTFTGALVAGALKFRLNDQWAVNYGSVNNDEGIAYFDNSGAHTIAEAGNYVVTFAVNPDPATATYTVTLID